MVLGHAVIVVKVLATPFKYTCAISPRSAMDSVGASTYCPVVSLVGRWHGAENHGVADTTRFDMVDPARIYRMMPGMIAVPALEEATPDMNVPCMVKVFVLKDGNHVSPIYPASKAS